MSWVQEATNDAVNDAIKVFKPEEIKEMFESYWPTEESIEEHPELAEMKNALAYAIDGFFDNNRDSRGEVGVDMVCEMLSYMAKKLETCGGDGNTGGTVGRRPV